MLKDNIDINESWTHEVLQVQIKFLEEMTSNIINNAYTMKDQSHERVGRVLNVIIKWVDSLLRVLKMKITSQLLKEME
jgi:hypothetical protein